MMHKTLTKMVINTYGNNSEVTNNVTSMIFATSTPKKRQVTATAVIKTTMTTTHE